jgi:hypothetical protein
MGQQTMAASLGIHVTGDLGMNRIEPLSAITSCLPGPVTTPPGSWTTGGSNHAGLAGRPQLTRGHEQGNGVVCPQAGG